ncbi:MAG: pyridoxamine 5'-phosphate oxidase family protein [Victivallales bacterium]|nr:pyridoxamine 5'-phosphate oxidase family protein [Victivallales bacterium]
MKKTLLSLLCLGMLVFSGCKTISSKETNNVNPSKEALMSIQTTYKFIKEAQTYYIATVDKDQPRVRPFGTIHIFENKLYIQTGRSKNVAKQLIANGKVEICAMKDKEWIRVSGVLVDDNRREAKASMLEEYASLKKIGYSEDDPNTMVLYFKPGTVTSTIYSFGKPPVEMKF